MKWIAVWEINEAVLLVLVALAVEVMIVVWIKRSSRSGYTAWIEFSESEWKILVEYGSVILLVLSLVSWGVIVYYIWWRL